MSGPAERKGRRAPAVESGAAGGTGPVVGVIDYGAGNLVSIRNALTLLGAGVRTCTREADLEDVDAIVMPGVGASAPAMARLRRQGLVEPIRERVLGGTWFVGICLGLQLLFERSDEDGARMLGLLEGEVVLIPDAPRLPHIGWNTLERRREHLLLSGLADGTPAYFVHSYVPRPADESVVVATSEHGGRFASLVATANLVGFQFHPERSGEDGLRLLANTLALVVGREPARDGGPSTPGPALAAAAAGIASA